MVLKWPLSPGTCLRKNVKNGPKLKIHSNSWNNLKGVNSSSGYSEFNIISAMYKIVLPEIPKLKKI